jgi:hypothetical protein
VSSVDPIAGTHRTGVDTVAGLLSAAALFFSLVALAYHPIPIAVASILLALIGAGMSSRHRTLGSAAVAVSALCFVGGVVVAVVTHHSLW